MLFYLTGFIKGFKDVEVECPACSARTLLNAFSFKNKSWVVQCDKCSGIFGVVGANLFNTYVKNEWSKKENPKVCYCDFIVHETNTTKTGSGKSIYFRWHGWVDKETRMIVQEG